MISINATSVIQVINFLILIWILNKFLFKPIFRILDERASLLDDTKNRIEVLQEEAEKKTKDYDTQLDQARKNTNSAKRESALEASSDAAQIIEKARASAIGHIKQIQDEAHKEANSVRAEMSQFNETLVKSMVQKIVGRTE